MQLPFIKLESHGKKWAMVVLVSITYVLLANYGLRLTSIYDNASPIWPASGFALASVLIFGPLAGLGVFIGAFIANYNLGTPVPAVSCLAMGNAVEALLGAFIIKGHTKKDYFKNYSEIVSIIFASSLGAFLSATIGISALYYLSDLSASSFLKSWYTWWTGDIIGILIVLPFALSVFSDRPWEKIFNAGAFLKGVLLLGMILLCLHGVFVGNYNEAFAWALGPVFIVLGVVSGRVFSSVSLIISSLYVIYLTAHGYGPFEQGSLNRNLLYVQTLITNFCFAVLFVRPLSNSHNFQKKYLIGLSLGWMILFVTIFSTSHYQQEHSRDDFNRTVASAIETIEEAVKSYELILKSSSTFFSYRETPDREEWNSYVHSSHLALFANVVGNFGYIEVVKDNELKRFIKQRRINYRTIQNGTVSSDDHYIITLSHSFPGSQTIEGFDLSTEPTRKKVIEKALLEKHTFMSEPYDAIKLNKGKIFLIAHPALDKTQNVKGLIFLGVQVSKFYNQSFERFAHLLRIRISGKNSLLHSMDKRPAEQFRSGPFFISKNITLFGLEHKIELYPTDAFFQHHSGYTAPLALLLNTFVLFIAGFLLEQITISEKTSYIIEEKTRELEQSKMQLIHSSKMASLGEMAGGMAHEINNPLTIIKGKIEVLNLIMADNKITDPIIFTELQKIKYTTDRIDKIIKGLNNFSRASDADPLKLIQLETIIQETLDLCSEKLKLRGIELKISPPPKGHVLCRPSQVSQVLINLLNNARDAVMYQNPKWVEIDFVRAAKDKIWIRVTDSGPGIPFEVAEKMMEPFFTTKEAGKGTGLGLSISRNIMMSHKGNIWLDRGHVNTRFVLEFQFTEMA